MTFEFLILFLISIIIIENFIFVEPIRIWIFSRLLKKTKILSEEDIKADKDIERVIHFLDYQNEYIKVVEEFEKIKNERIEKIYFNKMISDKMAGTASMTDDEALELRDDIYFNIIANLPKYIREVIFYIYTEDQLKLMILDTVSNKIRDYYRISSTNEKRGVTS